MKEEVVIMVNRPLGWGFLSCYARLVDFVEHGLPTFNLQLK
jgi:hypothetical protein